MMSFVVFVLWTIVLFHLVCPALAFLSLLTNRWSRTDSALHAISFDDAVATVAESLQNLSVPDMQRRILHKGMEFPQHHTVVVGDDFDRVPGCIATVHVRVRLLNNDTRTIADLDGTADAHMSRGLVAILAECLQGVSVQDVLEQSHAPVLPLQAALSPGRNDGWASLFRTVQKQLERRVEQRSKISGGLDDSEDKVKVSNTTSLSLSSPTTTDAPLQPVRQPSVALLLSGGVDSSVALRLLLNDTTNNYNVTAFYLKIWLQDELSHLNECPWEEDIQLCRQVCEQAKVPLEIVSLQDAYHERVITHTIDQAQAGRTPNPDILCNSRIKMGVFWEHFAAGSFDYMATGHYARVDRCGRLWRAPDPVKDQSYFLCALTSTQLQRCLFPIGHLHKSEVRALAESFQLPNRQRPDSQGLCFLGKVKFDAFLSCYLGDASSGPIVDALSGDCIGQHKGLHFHTVGQRKGIGKVLDPLATSRGPWYVVAKDTTNSVLYCSNAYEDDAWTEARSHVTLEDLHWIQQGEEEDPTGTIVDGDDYEFKIRHGARLARGRLEWSTAKDTVEIYLEQKDSGLAPGQTVAIYHRTTGECLGCGIISEAQWARFLAERRIVKTTTTTKG